MPPEPGLSEFGPFFQIPAASLWRPLWSISKFPFGACNAHFHEDFLAGRFIFREFHYNARIAHLDHEFEVQIQFFSELITSRFLRPGIANRKQKKQILGDFSEFREDLT